MSNTTENMAAISLGQVFNAICTVGHMVTPLVQGHTGTGKSTLLKMLAEKYPTHTACFVDCTTKDLGDLMLPMFNAVEAGGRVVQYAFNEELGLHIDGPVIIMIDEFGKATPAVKNGLLELMLNHRMGGKDLHPESIVFATTNLGAEGLGDILPAHARNRLSMLTMRKPTVMEWLEWAVNNNINPALCAWCKENPHVFNSFMDHNNPGDNPYIYHPKSTETSFVTPRSLEKASVWLDNKDYLDDDTLRAGLMGTIGTRAALDMDAFVTLIDDLPSFDEIKKDPTKAPLPNKTAAICMTVYKALASIDATWVDAWMTYMERLEPEAQGMFVNGVRAEGYSKRDIVITTKKFGAWATKNQHMFTADKV